MEGNLFKEKIDAYMSGGMNAIRERSPIQKSEPKLIPIGSRVSFTDYAKTQLRRDFEGGIVVETKPAWDSGYVFVRLEGRPEYDFIHESYFHCI